MTLRVRPEGGKRAGTGEVGCTGCRNADSAPVKNNSRQEEKAWKDRFAE